MTDPEQLLLGEYLLPDLKPNHRLVNPGLPGPSVFGVEFVFLPPLVLQSDFSQLCLGLALESFGVSYYSVEAVGLKFVASRLFCQNVKLMPMLLHTCFQTRQLVLGADVLELGIGLPAHPLLIPTLLLFYFSLVLV